MTRWIDDILEIGRSGECAILVTVAGVRGSAPREVGAKMLVTPGESIGSVGGGQLEYQCTRIAGGMLRAGGDPVSVLRRFPLGADCGQCCGGVVDILFEACDASAAWFDAVERARDANEACAIVTRFDAGGSIHRAVVTTAGASAFGSGDALDDRTVEAARQAMTDGGALRLELSKTASVLIEPLIPEPFTIAVFGAGHVGAATVAVLSALDCSIRWIDRRRSVLPERTPGNVQAIHSREPAREVAALPPGSYFLVMTHSHPEDYAVVRAVLARGDFAYCGLIGSIPKRRRFEKRLRQESALPVDRLTCPIGVAGITGKRPAEIAIAAAAEILRVRDGSGVLADSAAGGNLRVLREQHG